MERPVLLGGLPDSGRMALMARVETGASRRVERSDIKDLPERDLKFPCRPACQHS